jgi:transcriptional regulator with XRE-family HTH domain
MAGSAMRIPTLARKEHRRWYLKEWRQARGLTAHALAEHIGVSPSYISQLERGLRAYNQGVLAGLAEALRCEPADLIARDPADMDDGLWNIYEVLRGLPKESRTQVVRILNTFRQGAVDASPPALAAPDREWAAMSEDDRAKAIRLFKAAKS